MEEGEEEEEKKKEEGEKDKKRGSFDHVLHTPLNQEPCKFTLFSFPG